MSNNSHVYTEAICKIDSRNCPTLERNTYQIKTVSKLNPRLGVMMVGWGGNNGSTLTASLLAYKKGISWSNKNGKHTVKFFGSLSQYGSVHIGFDENQLPHSKLFREIGDFYEPSDIVVGGWDICNANIYQACKNAQVIDHDLLEQLKPELKNMVPLPSFASGDFISSNQSSRTNNVMSENTISSAITRIIHDISWFKFTNKLDNVIVIWTASTERMTDGKWLDMDMLTDSIESNDPKVSPSMVFAIASALSTCTFINCSPQNTICPALIELASNNGTFMIGSDISSGQTRLKSVLVDYLASSGVKPLSIVSYNHLGNNDGKNLDETPQFKSKEITKRNVIDDVVLDNPEIFNGVKPDHCVVIKYIPAVGDSKRAMDEYYSELMLDGRHTLVIHNTCEDSLLAVPVMLDLALFAEFFSRVSIRKNDNILCEFDPTLSLLSYFFKSPNVSPNEPCINSFFKKRYALESFFRILADLPPLDHLHLGLCIKK